MLVMVFLPALGLSAGFSARNPAVRNPVGVGTAPVSSYRNGLVTTPVPIDATADLSVTGNLRHGKHFRGNVPYRSTSDVGLDPGSSSLNSHRGAPSLNSFLRDTAGPEDFGRRFSVGYGARPYYSPAEVGARTVPGGAGVFAPQSTGNSFGVSRQERSTRTTLFALESVPGQHVLPERGTAPTAARFQRLQTPHHPLGESLSPSDGTFIRGISPGLRDAERLTPGEAAAVRRHDDRLTLERLREQSLQPSLDFRQDSAIADQGVSLGDDRYRLEASGPSSSAASVRDAVAGRGRLSPVETFRPSAESTPTLGKHDGLATRKTGSVRAAPGLALHSQAAVGSGPASREEHDDALGRIRQQLDALSKSVGSRLQAKPGSVSTAGVVAPTKKTHVASLGARRPARSLGQVGGLGLDDPSYLLKAYEPRSGREILSAAAPQSAFGPADNSGKSRFESPATGSLEAARKIRSLPDRVGELSRAEISAEAKHIMGRHRNHDSLAADKFSQHLRAGEDYLRAGKYYRSANSFALASVYRADDPLALAGRSHALFAAGEYISSALFLSRALAIRPEHVKVRVDFVTLLGGPNRLAGRIADIEQWFARSGSGQLQLLLSYVYYQTGRLNEAKRAIDAARTKMPESSAFSAITTAINDASIVR